MRLLGTVLFAVAVLAAACGGTSASSAPPASSPTSKPVPSAPDVPDSAQAWCINHTGGTGADGHLVEDAAIALGDIAGAKTIEDVSGRWAGRSMADLRLEWTYARACISAYAASSAAPS